MRNWVMLCVRLEKLISPSANGLSFSRHHVRYLSSNSDLYGSSVKISTMVFWSLPAETPNVLLNRSLSLVMHVRTIDGSSLYASLVWGLTCNHGSALNFFWSSIRALL